MGQSHSNTPKRTKSNKPRWRDVPNVYSKPSIFPSPKHWQQFLLSIDQFSALGRDVCALIASYLECFCEDGIVTANGYVNHPKLKTPLRFTPSFSVQASCSCMLPPFHIAFGTTLPGEHRATVSVYNAHTLQHTFNLLFPMQSAADFISPSPSVSSLLLIPMSTGNSIFDNAPCIAALDELGNLFIWRVNTQELLYTFNTKSPVFYSFSSLSLMPFSRLGLLLSGTPGPSQPSSRLVVFDLTTGETHKCSVDTLNSGVAFPVTFFVPPTTISSQNALSTNANRDPYCLYTDHSLCKWRMMYGTPELILAQTDWQWFNLREWRGEENRQWKYKYRSERILSTQSGTILRVEGTLQSVRVWIGSHIDRNSWAYFEYNHEFEVKEEVEVQEERKEEEEFDSREIYRHRNFRNFRNFKIENLTRGYDSASPRLCGYNLNNLPQIASLDDSDAFSESEAEKKQAPRNQNNNDDDEKQNVPHTARTESSYQSIESSPILTFEPSTDEENSSAENTTQTNRHLNQRPNVAAAAEAPNLEINFENLRLRRRGRNRRLPGPPHLQVSATFMKERKIAVASVANNGTRLLRVWDIIPVERFQPKESDIKMSKEEGCFRARCSYSKSFLCDPYRDHSILTQNSAPRIGLRHKEPFNLLLGSSW